MNRLEFSNLLGDFRRQSNTKIVDICAQMGVLPGDIRRIEKGLHAYSMEKPITFIKVIGGEIVLYKENSRFVIDSVQSISHWLKKARDGKYSQRALALEIGCTYPTIANIERGSNKVTVDNFLKLTDKLGYTIKIESL